MSWTSESKRSVNQKLLRKTVKTVADKKATYPSEVSSYVSQDPGTVGRLLRELEEAGFLERLKPRMKHSDQRLLDRRSDIEGGMKEFKKRNWYGLNSDLCWALPDPEKGVHVNEYHDRVEVVNPDRLSLVNRAVKMLDEKGGATV